MTMKNVWCCVMVAMVACNRTGSGDVTGTYVRYAESAYAKAWDTLVVRESEHGYAIQRRSGTQRKVSGKWMDKSYKRSQLRIEECANMGEWYEEKTGKHYGISPDGKSLFVEGAAYKKIR